MMNNTALLQHIASEFIAHSGVPAKPAFDKMGIRNFWLIKCQRCKEENLSQRII